jgi:hypothetical protein
MASSGPPSWKAATAGPIDPGLDPKLGQHLKGSLAHHVIGRRADRVRGLERAQRLVLPVVGAPFAQHAANTRRGVGDRRHQSEGLSTCSDGPDEAAMSGGNVAGIQRVRNVSRVHFARMHRENTSRRDPDTHTGER